MMVDWFEIPTDDLERTEKFYTGLFGWKIKKHTHAGSEYWKIATTNEKGEKTLVGAMRKRHYPLQPITIFIDVPSIDEYADKVKELGGKIVVPKRAVPETGYVVVCHDTENNCFALWETDENAK